jgi:glucosamine--fructose-6-phosphate aminotransferase (isomerizing)
MLQALSREVARLALDLDCMRPLVESRLPMIAARMDRLRPVAVGSGDSRFAAIAASHAWRELAGVELSQRSPQSLLYNPPSQDEVLVAVSASGCSSATVAAVGMPTALRIAITCSKGSPLAIAVDECIEIELPQSEPSPGVRTYQASLAMLIALAATVGETRGHIGSSAHVAFQKELFGLGETICATIDAAKSCSKPLALDIAQCGYVAVVGSGPHLGTAQYCAAKFIETAGVCAIAQDIEEWWHVERFAAPRTSPLIVLAPAGRSLERALTVARDAHGIGHPVTLVHNRPTNIGNLPMGCNLIRAGFMPSEALVPLTMAPFAPIIAHDVAVLLGRRPFEFGRAESGGLQ